VSGTRCVCVGSQYANWGVGGVLLTDENDEVTDSGLGSCRLRRGPEHRRHLARERHARSAAHSGRRGPRRSERPGRTATTPMAPASASPRLRCRAPDRWPMAVVLGCTARTVARSGPQPPRANHRERQQADHTLGLPTTADSHVVLQQIGEAAMEIDYGRDARPHRSPMRSTSPAQARAPLPVGSR